MESKTEQTLERIENGCPISLFYIESNNPGSIPKFTPPSRDVYEILKDEFLGRRTEKDYEEFVETERRKYNQQMEQLTKSDSVLKNTIYTKGDESKIKTIQESKQFIKWINE